MYISAALVPLVPALLFLFFGGLLVFFNKSLLAPQVVFNMDFLLLICRFRVGIYVGINSLLFYDILV